MDPAPVPLTVDFAAPAGRILPVHGVNLGPLQMNGWFDFSEEFKELAIPYTRLHDCPYAMPEAVDVHSIFPLFHLDPQDPANYRFAITDDYIQAILDTGSKITFRLGESIEHHTRNKYFVHPPADFEKWAAICVNIIRHYNEGWAGGFHHNIGYWEIWNEPWLNPLCWVGTFQDYYRLYEVAAKAIKRHNPALKVGGASASSGARIPFSLGFLAHCRYTGTPLDFFSWHQYVQDPAWIVEQAATVRAMLAEHGFPQTESHLNEWGYLPTEGWRFNSPRKDPACVRRAVGEIGGIPGASFTAAMLILLQDCPIDIAQYYWARHGLWGLWDDVGAHGKVFHAFRAFRNLLDTPHRVTATANDAATGYALLAGQANDRTGGILLANFRGRATDFDLTLSGWTGQGKPSCRCRVTDAFRDLEPDEPVRVTENERGVTLSLRLPAPSFCHIAVTPSA